MLYRLVHVRITSQRKSHPISIKVTITEFICVCIRNAIATINIKRETLFVLKLPHLSTSQEVIASPGAALVEKLKVV